MIEDGDMNGENLVVKEKLFQQHWAQIPLFVLRAPSDVLNPTTKLVYSAIIWRVREGGHGRVFPSHDTIAQDAGVSERTVRNALDALSELGLLRWQRRGLGQTNLYFLEEVPEELLQYGVLNGKHCRSGTAKNGDQQRQTLPANRSRLIEEVEVEEGKTSADARVAAPSHLDRPSKFNGSKQLDEDSMPRGQDGSVIKVHTMDVEPSDTSAEAFDAEADGTRRQLRGNQVAIDARNKQMEARKERREHRLEPVTVAPLPVPTPTEGKFGSTELWRFWRMSVASIMKRPEAEIGAWTVKQKSQARKLLETYDRKVVCDLVVWLASNWKAVCEMYKIRGAEVPTIGLTLGYRESFVAAMSKPLPKQGKLIGEYDPVSAAGDPVLGWRDDI